MALNDLKPFEELHHTDKILRLEWFGGVKSNVDEHDNPLIECLFSPLEPPNKQKGFTQPFLKRKDQFLAGIAVGYLPTLFLGQFLQLGRQLPKAHWPLQPEIITLELDVSNPTSVVECLLPDIGIDEGSQFIGTGLLDIANRGCIKKLEGKVVHASNKKTVEAIKAKGGGLHQQVIIHEMELARFYLTNSSYSSKNLFNGAFNDEQIGKKVINELHEKKWLDSGTGKGRFVYRHGYRKEDALTLGRIVLDPTQLALQAAQRVHKTIVKDRLNLENSWIGHPRTYFPFAGHTTLKLSGRYLKTSSGFVFLTYRIHSCSAPFPFDVLSYCDDTQPGGLHAPPDAPRAYPNCQPKAPKESSTLLGTSKSNEPPSGDLKALEIEMGAREFVGRSKVILIREKLKPNTYRGGGLQQETSGSKPNSSTGGPTSGDTSSAPQSITEEPFIASDFSADLTKFTKATESLHDKKAGWIVNWILVGEDSEYFNDGTSFFPRVPCDVHTRSMRQFSYMDDEKTIRRRFICAEFCLNGRYLYVFEAQRRPNGKVVNSVMQFKEHLPILLLHTLGYESVLGNDFNEVIRQTVINKTWPSAPNLGKFCRDDQSHGKGIQTVDMLASKIKRMVERNA